MPTRRTLTSHIAVAAAALTIGGVATASAAKLITGSQIKPGTITAKNLSKSLRAQIAKAATPGPQGPSGPAGPKGDPGSVAAYQAAQTAGALAIASTATNYVPVSLTLPAAGAFQVSCRLEIETFDPSNTAGVRLTVTPAFPGASMPADTQTMLPRFLNGVQYQDSRTWSSTYLVSVPGARALSLTVRSDLLAGSTYVSNGACTAIGVASGAGATVIP